MKIINIKFLFLILLLNFINSQIENITLQESNITISTITESKKYQIIPEFQALFLQIIVQGNFPPDTSNKNNYIISYYKQESNFEERNQFSKSFQGQSIMWLNNAQIKQTFFLSIECQNIPCDYSLSIIPKKLMDLSLNQKYTYYVTEENKQNRFILDIIPPKNLNFSASNIVQVWAKGGKNLVTILNGDKFEKFKKYNGYIIEIENNEHIRLILNVDATIGDLVTIGVIFFEDGISNIYENSSLEELIELDTLVKKDIFEKSCYKLPNTEYKKYYNLNYLTERDIDLYSHNIYDNMICGDLHPNLDEDFYSIQYTLKNRKSIILYNPIFYGPQYNAYIYQGESMAVIPIQPDNDYNFLNYYVYAIGIKKEIHIYDCDLYPLCTFDRNNAEKITQMDGYYNSYSYSFNKNQFEDKLKPINKKQKVLVLTCLNGVQRKDNYYCIFLINLYTDKTKIQFGQIFNQYRFSKEGNEDNFIINKNVFKSSNEEHGYINIETISGGISVIIYDNNNKIYEINNKKLFIIDKSIDNFPFQIKANKNSVYYLNYYGVRDNNYENSQFYAMHNGNYLFNLKKNENLHLQIYTLPSEKLITQNYPIFAGFYPLGCQIDGVRNFFENFTECYNSYLEPIPKKNDFYQFIYKGSEFEYGEFYQDGFYVNKTANENDTCLFYSSFFILADEKQEGGIILEHNIPRRVSFTQKYNELNFTYPHTEMNNDLNIHLTLLNEGKYKVNIFIREERLEIEYGVNGNTDISLKALTLKDICKDFNQLCRIYINIISQIDNIETFLEIKVNSNPPQ